jgi:mannose-1-phosphate guanylyltransferase/mannose-6-phosphate isomerase
MNDRNSHIYPVLLAGGTGTRLWPVSRERYPKQLVNFIGKNSLVQSTIKRMDPVLDKEKVRIVCGSEHFHEIARHMSEIGMPSNEKIICEPCGRNTAPAILLAALHIKKNDNDAVLCVFPADHVISDIVTFHARLKEAIKLAENGLIVTFGIKPGYPETGFGYIEGAREVSEGALVIKRFVEKPDKRTAERYVRAGNFFWNSGMFAFRAAVILDEFKVFQPELLNRMKALPLENTPNRDAYEQLPNISIDYAIMEKTAKGVVLPSDFGWSDIGSWKSLYDFLPKDKNKNVIDGDVIAKNTESSFIMGHDRLIASNRIKNMVVVETPDSVFVSDIDNSRDVKAIVAELKEKGRKEYQTHRTAYYPWGSITVLEKKENYRVDRLDIYPNSVFEEDLNETAATQIVVVEGAVKISGKKRIGPLKKGETISLVAENILKLENFCDGSALIVRVQTGLKR